MDSVYRNRVHRQVLKGCMFVQASECMLFLADGPLEPFYVVFIETMIVVQDTALQGSSQGEFHVLDPVLILRPRKPYDLYI